MKKIGVLGAGSWGTALTWLLTNNGHEVTLWSIMEAEVEMLRTKREHTSKLPGVKLQESIQLTSNLEEAMASGRFRQDLYYRLNVVPIKIPPLRERREDIVPLLLHFLEKNNQKFNLSLRLAPRTVELLAYYNWPGNVRELSNVLENMMIMTDGNIIEEHNIPAHIQQAAKKPLFIDTPDYFDSYKLSNILTEVEKEVIRKAIAELGPLRQVAVHLGIDVSTLVRKKRKYNI